MSKDNRIEREPLLEKSNGSINEESEGELFREKYIDKNKTADFIDTSETSPLKADEEEVIEQKPSIVFEVN